MVNSKNIVTPWIIFFTPFIVQYTGDLSKSTLYVRNLYIFNP